MMEDIYNPVWQVEFWINGREKYAIRFTYGNIPQIGDEVRFKGIVYKITGRIWIYDDKVARVGLTMKEVIPVRKEL